MKNAKNAIIGCALILLSGVIGVIGCENTEGTEDIEAIEQDTLASGGGIPMLPELSYEWALDIAEDVTGFSDPVVVWVRGRVNSSGILMQAPWSIGFRDPSTGDYCRVDVWGDGDTDLDTDWPGGQPYPESVSVSNAEIQDILDLVYDRVDSLDPSTSVRFTMWGDSTDDNTQVDVENYSGIPYAHLEFY